MTWTDLEADFWQHERTMALQGSGLTKDQRTGAAVVFSWLEQRGPLAVIDPDELAELRRKAAAWDVLAGHPGWKGLFSDLIAPK